MGSTRTINVIIVIEFIKEILQTRQKAFNIQWQERIHKSAKVKEIIEETELKDPIVLI